MFNTSGLVLLPALIVDIAHRKITPNYYLNREVVTCVSIADETDRVYYTRWDL